jgi:hypothetical protein
MRFVYKIHLPGPSENNADNMTFKKHTFRYYILINNPKDKTVGETNGQNFKGFCDTINQKQNKTNRKTRMKFKFSTE